MRSGNWWSTPGGRIGKPTASGRRVRRRTASCRRWPETSPGSKKRRGLCSPGTGRGSKRWSKAGRLTSGTTPRDSSPKARDGPTPRQAGQGAEVQGILGVFARAIPVSRSAGRSTARGRLPGGPPSPRWPVACHSGRGRPPARSRSGLRAIRPRRGRRASQIQTTGAENRAPAVLGTAPAAAVSICP